jgi:dihydroorotate dehydrogenase (NAD+) catalytic subunit
VGTANFIEPTTAEKIVDGIKKYCAEKQIASISDLTGSLKE